MKNIKELKKEYSKRKPEIRKRLREFKELKTKSGEELFIELCFCLCTPMSRAERVIQVINNDHKRLLLRGKKEDVAKALKGYARFHNNKAKYIVEARDKINLLKGLPEQGTTARDFLVSNFKGIGLKETSHFLRNVGYKDLAILDVHIIKCLYELRVLGSDKRPSSRKQYERMEEQFKTFSEKISIPLDELDLLFWSSRTGKILK
ncbi:N-glycosylase/DNA lyase [Candidatus Woesearchaeota archaeon]|nr:N-glycosylase/DNA lyase [Candidatus Woesearchaeota archaeon]